jgi:serine/threonine protein kinase
VQADPLIGRELAGYRIEEQIGKGGMGVVYRAEHLMLGRHDALKLLASDLTADTAFRERFLRESRVAATIEHPNVIPIHHAGEADGLLYLAMRYVRGADLRHLLSERKRLEPAETISLVDQVSSALDAAHRYGLIHRDVKPANILIEANGHVYLTDFGIAKHTRTRGGLTKTGSFLGTLDYAAPEQIEGKEVDGRVDVYALGCVLYQCLTGAAPYEKDSEVQLIYAHLLEPAPPITSRHPGLPRGLNVVLERALAKSRDERYATCGELAADLRTALEGGTVPPPAVPVPTRMAVPPPATPTQPPPAPPPTAPPPTAPPPTAPPPAAPPPAVPPSAPVPAPAPAEAPVWRRLPVLLTALAVIAGAIVAFVVLSGGSSNTFPNPAENSLLQLIPTQIRSTCDRLTAPPSATAAVSCRSGKEQSAYYRFSNTDAANSYYGLKLPTSNSRGTCSGLPRIGERPYAIGGANAGRVYCVPGSGGRAEIGWVDTRAKTFAQGVRNDGDQAALYQWWARSAGPLRSPGAKSAAVKTSTVPSNAVLFVDTFSNAGTGWPEVNDDEVRMEYSDGTYRVLVKPANQARLLSTETDHQPALLFQDVSVELHADVLSRRGAYTFGVVCRASSAGRYRLEAHSSGALLIARNSKVLKRSFNNTIRSGVNTLRGECVGGHGGPLRLELTLNGGKALSTTDKNPLAASGGVGIVTAAGSKGKAQVAYQDITVRSS